MSDTDLELLARFTRHHSEDAFAEIVRRHLDLVHSAALRQVLSPQLAEEVAQSAFLKLARQARQTNAIAMTTLQKTLIAATLVAAVSTAIYEAQKASSLRSQVQTLEKQASTAGQIENLTGDGTRQIAALRDENERLNRNTAELLKLRAGIGRLTRDSQELARWRAAEPQKPNDPMELAAKTLLGKINALKQRFEQKPNLAIPELTYLKPDSWASVAHSLELESDDDVRQALCRLRNDAKEAFAPRMGKALIDYIVANNGQLPSDILQLKAYFESPVDDALLQRYELLHTGNMNGLPTTEPLAAEKAPTDEKYDSLFKIGASGYSYEGIGISSSGGHATWATKEIERVKPFSKQD